MKKSTIYAFCCLLYVNFMLAQAPSVDSFVPTTVCVGDTISISGSNFTTATEVTLGGVALSSFSVIDDNTISAVIDTGLSGDVVVVNGDGSGSLAGFVMNPNSDAGTASASVSTVCTGTNSVLLSLTGYVGTIQWQSSTDNSTFTNLTGETSDTYTATDLTVAMYYRAVVTSGTCSSSTSNVVTITVSALSSAGSVGASATSLCSGTNSSLLTLTGSTGAIQWQSSTDNATYSDLTGENGTTYTAADLTQTTYYRVVVTNGACSSATSSAETVTVSPTSDAGTASVPYTEVCYGINSVMLTLADSVGSIQWQSSTDNVTFSDVVGEVAATYTATDLLATTYFRAVVTSGSCSSATSNVITITVGGESVGGTISQLSFKCTGEGQIELHDYTGEIQWQISTDNLTFVDLDGEVGTTLSFTGLTDTTYYRAVVTNSVCSSAYSTTYTAAIRTTVLSGTEWSNGDPGADAYVTISSNYTSPGDLLACALVVDSGAIVLIPSGSNVVLEDKLTVEAGSQLILSSNSNLVQATDVANSGDLTVRRNSAPIKRLDYTLWSSPVVGQQLMAFSPGTLSTRFYTYNPSTDLYVVANTALDFATGKGYLIRTPNNHPSTPTSYAGHFTGVPNNGPLSVSVTNGGYNAIGNPYPSTIDADAFITDNSITEALYFWRKTNNAAGTAYATYTLAGGAGTANDSGAVPNGTIQVGQGFIAKATASTVTFSNSMRVVDNNNQMFKSAPERSRYWLNLSTTEGNLSQTMVAYMTNATNDYDAAIDGKYFNDSATALTTVFNDQEYAIQGRSLPFVSSDVVSLGFKAETAGTYTIALDHTDGLFGTQEIYLRDTVTNTIYDLAQGGYSFSTSTGVFNSRFEVVYQNGTLGVAQPNLTQNNLVVYTQNQQVVVNAGSIVLDHVALYDIQGRLLTEVKKINASEIKLPLDSSNAIILVKATAVDGTSITKKIIK